MISYQKIDKNYRRHIVCGDIHGCFTEFRILLDAIGFSPDDLLITVGDMVYRGPFSREAALFFKNTPNAFAVLGNHERKLAGVIRGIMRPNGLHRQTLKQIPKQEHVMWADYFESLPAVLETEHCIVTHARLDPKRSLQAQDAVYTCAVAEKLSNIKTVKKRIPIWYHKWAKAYPDHKPICMGHKEYAKIDLAGGRLYALDTRAVYGKSLSAVIFPRPRFVTVMAQKDYSQIASETLKIPDLDLDNPGKWRLGDIRPFLLKDRLLPGEKVIVRIFRNCMVEKKLAEKIWKLRARIKNDMHAGGQSGAFRRKFSRQLKKADPELNGRLLPFILSSRVKDLHALFGFYRENTLEKVIGDLQVVERQAGNFF